MKSTHNNSAVQQNSSFNPFPTETRQRPLFALFSTANPETRKRVEPLLTKEEQAICDMATD